MRQSHCACACMCMSNGVTRGRKGRWLLRKDDFSSSRTYRSPPRPYTEPIPILGKSTLGIENGDESAGGRRREGAGVAGSRWTEGGGGDCAREGGNARRNERKEESQGAVFTKGHVAPSFFFSSARQAIFRFFLVPAALNFPPRIFRDFVRGRKQKGRRSVKSNSANARRFAVRKHSGLHVVEKKLAVSAIHRHICTSMKSRDVFAAG